MQEKSTTRTTKSFAFPISAAGQQEFFCVSLLTENVCENPRMDKFVTKCCRSSAVFPCRKLILALRSQTDGRVPRLRGKIKPGVAVCRACGAILDKEKAASYGLGPAKRTRRDRSDGLAETEGAGKPVIGSLCDGGIYLLAWLRFFVMRSQGFCAARD